MEDCLLLLIGFVHAGSRIIFNSPNLLKTVVYPGMTLHFPVAAFDVFNQVTFGEISLMLLKMALFLEQNSIH